MPKSVKDDTICASTYVRKFDNSLTDLLNLKALNLLCNRIKMSILKILYRYTLKKLFYQFVS